MALNIFEGGRRIAKLLAALWTVGVVAVFAFGDRPSVDATFVVAQPGAAPMRADSECAYEDASEYDYTRRTGKGTRYDLKMCFTAHRFPAGMLVPFKIDAEGAMWGNERYESEVTTYTRNVLSSFVPSPQDEAWIDSQRWHVLWKHIETAIRWTLGGVLVIWLLSTTIGWILRGFLGVPTGRDNKPGDDNG